MALSEEDRAALVNGYTRVLITAWSSEEYSARLSTDPHGALAEAGLAVPADAEIEIDGTIAQSRHEGNLDHQVELWEIGLATGHYKFHIPATPQIDISELNEQELDLVAGGAAGSGDEIVISDCCCCPCCCCT